jgi:hypothetical protein
MGKLYPALHYILEGDVLRDDDLGKYVDGIINREPVENYISTLTEEFVSQIRACKPVALNLAARCAARAFGPYSDLTLHLHYASACAGAVLGMLEISSYLSSISIQSEFPAIWHRRACVIAAWWIDAARLKGNGGPPVLSVPGHGHPTACIEASLLHTGLGPGYTADYLLAQSTMPDVRSGNPDDVRDNREALDGDTEPSKGRQLVKDRLSAKAIVDSRGVSEDDDDAIELEDMLADEIRKVQARVCTRLGINNKSPMYKDFIQLTEWLEIIHEGGRIEDGGITAIREEYPWMGKATALIERDLMRCRNRGIGIQIKPILLVGPPGAGKTRYATRLGEALGLYSYVLNASGSSDNRTLQGTAAGWGTATPSWPVECIADCHSANPLLIVDEIEKTSEERKNGRIADSLIAMLERESASRWYDEALKATVDISHCNWIFTANSLDGIPAPLLDRLRVVRLENPSREHIPAIIKSIVGELADEIGTDARLLMPEPEIVQMLTSWFMRHGQSIRRLKRAVESAVWPDGHTLRDLH